MINRPVQSIDQTVVQVVSTAQSEEACNVQKEMTNMVNIEKSREEDREVTDVPGILSIY